MAVFTKLNQEEIINFINTYNIGKLESFNEIIEGIENTNYKIVCNNTPYILTIFEKRVNEKDLPFFIDLKLYLNNNNFKCPKPVKNKNDNIINSLKNKKAIIISFIEGEKIINPSINECYEVGKAIGELHNLSKNFNNKKENSLSINELKKIFHKCKNNNQNEFNNIFNELETEIKFIENSYPKNLPSGIIHADLFKDNIFFIEKKISGVIDFYFSCYDYLLYDICIVINDWCFENNSNDFNKKSLNAVLKGYKLSRTLENSEINSFNIILRLASLRILITRLHDYLFHPIDAIVVKKDPYEYFKILKWHQNNKVVL